MSESTINQRLKFLIDALGMKVSAFSRILGVSETTTRNYTDRTTKPGSDYLEKIASHFKQVNLTWLLTGEGEHFLPSQHENVQQSIATTKNNYGNNVDNNKGTVTQHQGQDSDQFDVIAIVTTLENTKILLFEAKKYSAQLESQLADKERTIQILLGQQQKPT